MTENVRESDERKTADFESEKLANEADGGGSPQVAHSPAGRRGASHRNHHSQKASVG